ncbi:MAG: patatin family protein [Acholeplasmatales bacterium]|nr:patatin family protein [Acholeplasmatales bacterium]
MKFTEKEICEILKDIPLKKVYDEPIDGAIVLEGGAFRGVYQEGVLDCLMQHGINFKTTIGVSAGALNGVTYTTGQVGRNAHINIRYRHDGRYVGINAFLKSRLRSVIGFDFAFGDLPNLPPIDVDALKNNGRKFYVVATNLETGKAEYFDNSRDDFLNCVRASATLPFISRPVLIDGKPYLDGGCDDRIPYWWAKKEGYDKVIVIRTRDRDFRIKDNFEKRYKIAKRLYSNYPDFAIKLARTDVDYDALCDEIEIEEKKGNVFVIYPSEPINVKMLEGDLNKLKSMYVLGYNDALNSLDRLKEYLNN